MADANGRGPRLFGPDGVIAPRDDSDPVADIQLLYAQVHQLRGAWEDARTTLNIQHQALTELTAAVQELERRSLRGRIRRLKTALIRAPSLQALWQYAMAMGLIRSPIIKNPRNE